MKEADIQAGKVYEGVSGQQKRVDEIIEKKSWEGKPRESISRVVKFTVIKKGETAKGVQLNVGDSREQALSQFSSWADKEVNTTP